MLDMALGVDLQHSGLRGMHLMLLGNLIRRVGELPLLFCLDLACTFLVRQYRHLEAHC